MTQQAAMSCNRDSSHRFKQCWQCWMLVPGCVVCFVSFLLCVQQLCNLDDKFALWSAGNVGWSHCCECCWFHCWSAVSAAGPLLQRSGGTLRAGFGQSFSRGQLTHHHHRHLISSGNLTPAIQSPDNPPSRALRQSRLCVALEWRPASQGGNCSNGGTTKPSFRIPAGAGEPLRGR